MFEDLVELTGIGTDRVAGARCRHRKATAPLAALGCRIVAVEPGPNLAAVAARNSPPSQMCTSMREQELVDYEPVTGCCCTLLPLRSTALVAATGTRILRNRPSYCWRAPHARNAAWRIAKRRLQYEDAAEECGTSVEMVRWRVNITGVGKVLAGDPLS